MFHYWNREVDLGLLPIWLGPKLKADIGRWLTIASRFVLNHAREIREGGLPALLRKGRKLLLLLILPPFLPIVILIRVLRPIIVIRVGSLISNQIGHFGANTELYLCERDAGLQDSRAVDIFYHTAPVCNQQLKKMWDRMLHVSPFARPLAIVNRRLPGYAVHVIPMPSDKDPHGLLGRMRAHLSFTPEEEKVGQAGLRNLGIPEEASFVCFHSRDSAYLKETFPDLNLRYHDYRDSSIHNCIAAAEELVCRGYFAIRMGAIVKEPLKITDPKIIDYAANGSRTDFMDIFLCARCRFFVGAAGGLNSIPRIFRRPIVFTNVVPLGRDHLLGNCGPNNLFIPKKLWLRESGRFMTFREIIESGAGGFFRTEQYEQLGLEVVENAPEEITAAVIEMEERLKGRWRTTEEDEDLQRRFWSFFDLSDLRDRQLLRVGAYFLRQNREMLD